MAYATGGNLAVPATCAAGSSWPMFANPRDPFDRMLIAEVEAEHLVVVTRDRTFDPYEVDILRY